MSGPAFAGPLTFMKTEQRFEIAAPFLYACLLEYKCYRKTEMLLFGRGCVSGAGIRRGSVATVT